MSVHKTAELYCDDCGDPLHSDIGTRTVADCREDAKERGWVRRGGRDYCQNCRPERRTKRASQ